MSVFHLQVNTLSPDEPNVAETVDDAGFAAFLKQLAEDGIADGTVVRIQRDDAYEAPEE